MLSAMLRKGAHWRGVLLEGRGPQECGAEHYVSGKGME